MELTTAVKASRIVIGVEVSRTVSHGGRLTFERDSAASRRKR